MEYRLEQLKEGATGLHELPESEVRRQKGVANRFGGDGITNVAIHPFYTRTEGHEARFGMNHIGFLVNFMQRPSRSSVRC